MNFLPPGVKPNPKKHQGKAITYFGNDIKSKKEIWLENDDLRTHVLIFGTTGAGKALKNAEEYTGIKVVSRQNFLEQSENLIQDELPEGLAHLENND